jgi:hypothetical protein
MSDVSIPVAYCPNCDENGPVVVENVKSEWFGIEPSKDMAIVYCPGCDTVLNFGDGDVEVTWYDPGELEKATGWRLSDG